MQIRYAIDVSNAFNLRKNTEHMDHVKIRFFHDKETT